MAYDPEGEWPTVANLTKDLGADNMLLKNGIQLLNKMDDMADDIPYIEASEKSSHVHYMDADIPTGTWRSYNEGIKAVDSSSVQVRETMGLYENRAEVDLVLARASGDVASFRATKDRRIVEGIAQDMATTTMYGDPRTNPKRFFGFSPRYDSLGNPSNKPAANTFGMNHVLNAGGATASSQSSIWLIGWQPEVGAFGIYPNSAPNAGIEIEDLGIIDLHDKDGNVFRGYATHYRVQRGIAVADWRYIARIANVEITSAMDEAAINTLCDAMIDATLCLPSLKDVKTVFYCNRTVQARLMKMANRKANMSLGFGDLYGVKNQLNISNIPIKTCDSILNTEAVIS